MVEVDAILNLVAIIGDLWRYHGDLQMDWSHFPGDAKACESMILGAGFAHG